MLHDNNNALLVVKKKSATLQIMGKLAIFCIPLHKFWSLWVNSELKSPNDFWFSFKRTLICIFLVDSRVSNICFVKQGYIFSEKIRYLDLIFEWNIENSAYFLKNIYEIVIITPASCYVCRQAKKVGLFMHQASFLTTLFIYWTNLIA